MVCLEGINRVRWNPYYRQRRSRPCTKRKDGAPIVSKRETAKNQKRGPPVHSDARCFGVPNNEKVAQSSACNTCSVASLHGRNVSATHRGVASEKSRRSCFLRIHASIARSALERRLYHFKRRFSSSHF